ncbi:MAG: hypothetical protein KIT56_10315 [Gammaproteobacteria bacterium]|nr:hypothetical protein [Gammaproteobacteria bacterium]MCW5584243.1 hypothetical protein [Gammaproteobacteria bacterium]
MDSRQPSTPQVPGRVSAIRKSLSKEINTRFYGTQHTEIDWSRERKYIYFGGKKALSDDTKPNTETILNTDPEILEYIQNYAHQHGFLYTSMIQTTATLFSKGINPNVSKKRFDFIRNHDGSITFIERFYINKYNEQLPSGLAKAPITSSKPDRPIAIGVTASTIRVEDGKIEHEFLSDKILLVDPLGEKLFNHNDGILEEKYHCTPEEIETELNNDITLHMLHNEIQSLSELFDSEKATTILEQIGKLAAESTVNDINWITLGSVITKIINVIKAQTSIMKEYTVEQAKSEKIEQYYDDLQRAGTYSAQSVQPTPDPHDNKYKFTEEDAHRVRDNFKFTEAADRITSSPAFTKLKDLLKNKVATYAEQQRTNTINQRFHRAYRGLQNTAQASRKNPDSPLKAAGRGVLNRAIEAERKTTQEELSELTKFVEGTTDVVSNPDDKNIEKHAQNTKNAIGKKNCQWGKLVGGAMLCVLGATLIATSLLLVITTFGVATPLSAFGIAFASKMTVAGVVISAAAVGASLTTTAGIFADRGRKGELAVAGERVEKEARKARK